MTRPLRIEYYTAWYHVMTPGAGRGCVFPDNERRPAFLHLLRDVHEYLINVEGVAAALVFTHRRLASLTTPLIRHSRIDSVADSDATLGRKILKIAMSAIK